ncbi:ATP-binding protein [Novosphingobium sp. Fuku2-ISO-50]|uniref:HAMP domain-containing sensor histidine kinase n=1 Tax=Novosphingobium sp. Fuku2-ISO-50 TaxID=1739114 RepID=UPI00076CF73D|nr:ATP-binding protein [Novosphingobium sp. Fuku2-ISO-50]KUR77463.1 hypothetical protein AQZ50_09650 [Novosphingobium sp. Fuku2-ISO-50]
MSGAGISRHRLFGKILLAFLLTYLAITQTVWLVYALGDKRDPPEMVMAREIGPSALEAGAQALARGGAPAFTEALTHLSPLMRGHLGAYRTAPLAPPMGQAMLTRQAIAPDGQVWHLRFTYRRDGMASLAMHTPPEVLLLGLIAGLIFSAALAWYLLLPINHMRFAFAQLAQGALSTRLSPRIGKRRDEIADLGRDFDQMAQRLENLVADRDRLLHDVSHELRSPLARIQLSIALARQSPERIGPAMDRMEIEIARIDAMVGELLILARAEHDQAAGEDYFDVAGVAASVVEDARYEAQVKAVTIALTGVEADQEWPLVRGNSELVRRALENVLRNALRYSPQGGRLEVEVTFGASARLFRIRVCDQGPGVSAHLLTTMFEPFVRGEGTTDEAGSLGAGLGLAIASRAIAAHGGRISASNRRDSGLRIDIEIPAADA